MHRLPKLAKTKSEWGNQCEMIQTTGGRLEKMAGWRSLPAVEKQRFPVILLEVLVAVTAAVVVAVVVVVVAVVDIEVSFFQKI